MKTLIVFSLLFSLNSSAKAVDTDSSKGLDESVRKITGLAPSENIDNLAINICMKFKMDGNKVASEVKKVILLHLKTYEDLPNPSVDQIIKFLNHNKNYMTCGNGNHYMKEAFDHGKAYDQLFNVLFFDELLSDDDSLYIDVNAVSMNKAGNPETVLDYMYKQYADMTNTKQIRDEIKSLIETFEIYLGGKKYVNLRGQVR